jgi:hypothetical protein
MKGQFGNLAGKRMHCASPRHYFPLPIVEPADIGCDGCDHIGGCRTRPATPNTPDLPVTDETRLGRDHAVVKRSV